MISKVELAKLKSRGILAQKEDGYFSIRVLSRAGNFTAHQLITLSNIADKYGKGYVGFTTRLTAEIPWIKYEDIETVSNEIISQGLNHGGTGKKVRPLVACKGTVCVHGLYNTQELCGELHDSYFAYDLPSKTKITLVGCPNNCAKANTNDIGIVGQAYVQLDENKCKNCGLCTTPCREKSLTKVDNKLVWDKSKCVNCGKCANVCPFEAMTIEKEGLSIYLGGRMGRGYRFGDQMTGLYTEEQISYIIQNIFDTYKELANDGERISKLIERIGFTEFENSILNKINYATNE